MEKIYIIDTNTALYDKIKPDIPSLKFVPLEACPTDFDGFTLVNADNCGDFCPISNSGVGVILVSGDINRVCEGLKGTLSNIFCSASGVTSFFTQNTIWHSDFFNQIRNTAELYLRYMGMSDRLSGFSYMGFLITYMTLTENAVLKYDVYPIMEEFFHKTMVAMERSMRYAVEVTWSHGNFFAQEELFGNSISPARGKPQTTEFAAMLSQRIRNDMYERA